MKILVVQNRMGIGDMVIFLPFIEAISKKYNSPVSILVKANSKASEFLGNNKYINNIIILDRDNKSGSHDGLLGSIKLIKELKIKTLSKLYFFRSEINLTDPLIPSWRPLLELSRSKIIISLIFLLLENIFSALEFSLTRTLTGVSNFFDIASMKGKKITISPIPLRF